MNNYTITVLVDYIPVWVTSTTGFCFDYIV